MQTAIYPWQQPTWQAWQTLLMASRLHHAILYSAPAGSGRLALAATLAKTVLCREQQAVACGHCHSCQLFEADTHPDFHHLKPEANKQLGVDSIRAGNKFAWQTSQLGGKRVILIEAADRMGEAASNALLKTLEEPPQHCQFILLASGLNRLLPTVVSRCNKWVAPALPEPVVKAWLEAELQRPVSLQSVRLYAESPLSAKVFIEQGQEAQYLSLLSQFADFIGCHQGLISVAAQLGKQEAVLEKLALALVDALKVQQSPELELVHCDAKAMIAVLVLLPTRLLLSQLRALNQLNVQLKTQTGLNTELLLTNWLTQFIHSEIHAC